MVLTLFAIQNAKPHAKSYRLSDGNGLSLLIEPTGSKLWRFRYFFGGKENMLTLGAFPVVTLATARAKRDAARQLMAEGIDPAKDRKEKKATAAILDANTFGVIAAEYIAKLADEGKASTTVDKNRWLLQDLADSISLRPIAEIEPAEILDLLKKIEKSGRRDTARRLRGTMGSVFRFAIVTLRAKSDPTQALRGALLAPQVTHRPAIIDECALGALMHSIDEYDGWPTLRAALQLLALTMTRPGDVRHMRRSEIVFPKALWRIPAERMKMRRPHDVPLSRQALKIVRDIWNLAPESDLVLPSIRSSRKPLSENAMNSALRRLGYAKNEVTAHGFRASASTILNERGFDGDVIEAALAHQEEDDVRRAYNRATYLVERTKLMQHWADLLDQFKASSIERGASLAS